MSETGHHFRTHAIQQKLFDDLVARAEGRWYPDRKPS
jgi:hypothetical protein